jgi:hypothetical protein
VLLALPISSALSDHLFVILEEQHDDEAPYYATLFFLLTLPDSYVQYFSSAPCYQATWRAIFMFCFPCILRKLVDDKPT